MIGQVTEFNDTNNIMNTINEKASINYLKTKNNSSMQESRNNTNNNSTEQQSKRLGSNSENNYINSNSFKKNIYGLNMSALSKLRVSLAQNNNSSGNAENFINREI